jgi:anti-sigma-K factor RskA
MYEPDMSNGKHITELLPAYALGCLDREEEILVSEHLAHCTSCQGELRTYQNVADEMALAAPEVLPRVELRQELMARFHSPPPSAAVGGTSPWWIRMNELWRRIAPAWGLVSLVLILALAVRFAGTDAAPGATGTLVLSVDGTHGTLVVDGLTPLDETQAYQLWLIKDGQRTDGGLIPINRNGYGALWVSSPEPLSSYQSFGVTVEPAGGSPGPTGEKVLGGSL